MSNVISSPFWQQKIDRFWQLTVLRFLPQAVSPNYLSIFRLILIPLVLYFLVAGHFLICLLFIVISALTDTLDGALARCRRHFSPWGLLLDPLADKLLIILTSIFLLYYYPYPAVLLLVIIFDLLMALSAALVMAFSSRQLAPSNRWGKAKMLCQVGGLIGALVALGFTWPFVLALSALLFTLAVIFEIISGLSYLYNIITPITVTSVTK